MCFSPRIFEGLGLLAANEEKRGNVTFGARIFKAMCALSSGDRPPTSDLTLALLMATCCDVVPSDLELKELDARVFTKSVLTELRILLQARDDVKLVKTTSKLWASESAFKYWQACLVTTDQTEADSGHLDKKQKITEVASV